MVSVPRVVNDLLTVTNEDKISVLLLLDLSAAFDTIGHQILLSRLETVFGIRSTAVQWFRSYLLDRNQSIVVNKSASSPSPLMFGVPQGSVLGPVLLVLYTTPLSDIAGYRLGCLQQCNTLQHYSACIRSTISCLQTTSNFKNQLKIKFYVQRDAGDCQRELFSLNNFISSFLCAVKMCGPRVVFGMT